MPSLSPHTLVVRDAEPPDLVYTALQHERELPHGLFPRLGRRFLRRWHTTFVDSRFGIALVAEHDTGGGPVRVGFLLGSTDQRRLVDDVLARERLQLLVAGGAALLLRPRLATHFARTRARPYLRRLRTGRSHTPPGGSPTGPVPGTAARPQAEGRRSAGPVAVLSAVVVDAACRSTGAGHALVEAFLARAADAGVGEARLTTLTGPGGAGPFYEKGGWQFVEQHLTRDGLMMSTYRTAPYRSHASTPAARSTRTAPSAGPAAPDSVPDDGTDRVGT